MYICFTGIEFGAFSTMICIYDVISLAIKMLTFMGHLDPWTLTEVEMTGHVFHLSWLQRAVPAVWVVVAVV